MKNVIDVLLDAQREDSPFTPCGISREKLKAALPYLMDASRMTSVRMACVSGPPLQSWQCMPREACLAFLAIGLLGLRGHEFDLIEQAEAVSEELVRLLEKKTGRGW
jgi:hypothetical protein